MLESHIMNEMRRTTISARREDLATLEAEAGRQGIPLTVLVAEAIAEKAADLRSRQRPRLGVAHSSDGRSAGELTSEPVARPPRA